MRHPRRNSASFTLDQSILDYLQRTRSGRSRSERANELLRRAILDEQNETLEKEAGRFFAAVGRSDRAERKAATLATQRSITRGERISVPHSAERLVSKAR